MKKVFLVIMTLTIFSHGYSQVSINTDSSTPDPSAGLDVKFINKGLLPPRLSHAQMNTITNPANGLLVFCTDCGNSGAGTLAMFFNGSWNIFTSSCLLPLPPASSVHLPLSTQIAWNWSGGSDVSGYRWNTTASYASAIDVGNATSYAETGLSCNTAYTRYVWSYNACGNSEVTQLSQATLNTTPATPAAGTNLPSANQIVWNWYPAINSSGYKWNTINNYGTATDMGTNTTYTETGLTCYVQYTRYVWAYSSCGASAPVTLVQVTAQNPPPPFSGAQVPSSTQITWNWNLVPGATGYKWSTTNYYFGATDLGTATTKTETGLNCNTSYTRYVWAYNTCGYSTATGLTQTTLNIPVSPLTGVHPATATQITWTWNPSAGATGYRWSSINDFNTATDVGNAVTHTESGLTCNTAYSRYIWSYNSCGYSPATIITQTTLVLPAPATEGVHVAFPEQITWQWNAAPGATGYRWNTVSNYATSVDMGSTTSKIETGLTCNTAYTRYVWAYNSCGNATATPLSKSTSLTPSSPLPATPLGAPTQITWNW